MSYEEAAHISRPVHRVIMEQRERMSVSGVESVDSFDEAEVVIQTPLGRLVVTGDSLHVGKLSLDTGEVSIDGVITGLAYEESVTGGSLWTRLFK